MTQISAETPAATSDLSAFMNSFKCMLRKQSNPYVWKEMKSFSVPLCLSLFSFLWCALPRCCSFSLLSRNQTYSLHRPACHPIFIQSKTASICTFLLQTPSCLSIYQPTVHSPPALDLTKTIQTVTLPLSGFILISAELWKKSQCAAGS